MTLDPKHLRELHANAASYIEMETKGAPWMQYDEPSADSKAFYVAAHEAMPQLLASHSTLEARVRELEEALGEACAIAERVIADVQVLPSADYDRITALRALAAEGE